MRRVAMALLVLFSMVGSAEARTLFTSHVACADSQGSFIPAIKGSIAFHFHFDVVTVKARLEGLAGGATASAGYLCTIEGNAPVAPAACPTPANNGGKLACSVSFPATTSCAGGSPFIIVSSPAAECGPGFLK